MPSEHLNGRNERKQKIDGKQSGATIFIFFLYNFLDKKKEKLLKRIAVPKWYGKTFEKKKTSVAKRGEMQKVKTLLK